VSKVFCRLPRTRPPFLFLLAMHIMNLLEFCLSRTTALQIRIINEEMGKRTWVGWKIGGEALRKGKVKLAVPEFLKRCSCGVL